MVFLGLSVGWFLLGFIVGGFVLALVLSWLVVFVGFGFCFFVGFFFFNKSKEQMFLFGIKWAAGLDPALASRTVYLE